jgi:hypothetical protein
MSSFALTKKTFPGTYGVNGATLVAGGSACIVVLSPTAAQCAVSTDSGSNWTTYALPHAGACEAIAYNGTHFMAVRGNKVSFSTDGVTWGALVTVPTITGSGFVLSVACNASGWLIAYAGSSSGYLAYSSNRTSFTVSDPTGHATTGNEWCAVGESGGTWYAVARDLAAGANCNKFYSSANGTTWSSVDSNMMGPAYPTDTPSPKLLRKLGSTIILAGGNDSGMIVSLDSGASWVYESSPGGRGYYLDFNAAGTAFVFNETPIFAGTTYVWDGTGDPSTWAASIISDTDAALRNVCSYNFGSDMRLCAVNSISGAYADYRLGILEVAPSEFWTNLLNATETIGG